MAIMTMKQSEYVLGHTDREQLRLIRQARALAPATEHFLRDAGLVSGMRVLDIGCGMGDVTMLVAQRVGPAGRIVSIDLDQASIETARGRAVPRGSKTPRSIAPTLQCSKMPSPSTQSLDALCWSSPDPRATIDRSCGLLRPGGSWRYRNRAGSFGSLTRRTYRCGWRSRRSCKPDHGI